MSKLSNQNNHPQNDDSFPSDRPSLRRRPHPTEKGQRIHRNRMGQVGPDYVQWKMDTQHSDPVYAKSLSLDLNASRVDPGIRYSINRKKRWELADLEDFGQFWKPNENQRFSRVLRAVNPLGGTNHFTDPKDGPLEETNVLELYSQGGNGDLSYRSAKAGRGMNSMAQLFQKGERPSKHRKPRKGRGLELEEDEEKLEQNAVESPWLDLFDQPKALAQKTKAKKSGRNKSDEKLSPRPTPRMHLYYTVTSHKATRHQLDTGWKDRLNLSSKNAFAKKSTSRKMAARLQLDEELDEEEMTADEECAKIEEAIKPKRKAVPMPAGPEAFEVVKMEEVKRDEPKRSRNWWMDAAGTSSAHVEPEEAFELQLLDLNLTKNGFKMLEQFARDTRLPEGTAIYDVDVEVEEIKQLLKELQKVLPGSLLTDLSLTKCDFKFKLLEKFANAICVPMESAIYDIDTKMVESLLEQLEQVPAGALLIRKKIGERETKWFLNPAASENKKEDSLTTIPSTKKMNKKSAENSASAEFFQELKQRGGHRSSLKLLKNEKMMSENKASLTALKLFQKEQQVQAVHRSQAGDEPWSMCSSNSSETGENSPKMEMDGPNYCEVCFVECKDVSEGFSLPSCHGPFGGHLCCYGCWQRHIKQCLTDGRVPIRCMVPLCPSILQPDCALLVVDQSTVGRYRQLLGQRRRMRKDFLTCPKCEQLLHLKEVEGTSANETNCLTICGHCSSSLCVNCGRRQHLPLDCEQRDLYEHVLRANSQSLDSLTFEEGVNVTTGVRCSRCRHLVWKAQGCSHMTCRCGHQFCWDCGADYQNHRSCSRKGQITVPLFDNHVFLNPFTGLRYRRMPRYIQVLAKLPEKFLSEYAKIRLPREKDGAKMYTELQKVYPEKGVARRWCAKYQQMSEFVELSLVKSQLARNNENLKNVADKLLLNFNSLLLMARLLADAPKDDVPISQEMVESGYSEMMALCRQILRHC